MSQATRALTTLSITLLIVFSPARAASPAPAGGLPDTVQRVMAAHQLSPQHLSVYVQEVGAEKPLLEFNAAASRNPASTIKLLTTYVALDVLSPGYTWTTEAHLEGELDDGRLDGDLILKGTGDPFLTTERFWTFLRRLQAKGLQHISGDLVIDNGYFDVEPEDPAAFDGQPFRTYNVAPDALLVNFKAVRFRFVADPPRRQVRIVPDPALPNLNIENRIRLGNGYCRGYQRGIAFNVPGGLTDETVVFDGRFPAACEEYSFARTVLTPHEFAYGTVKYLGEEMGGSISGDVRLAAAPQEVEPYLGMDSPTLAEIIRSVNKFSNNVMTRHLLLTLGAETFGPPGTRDKGTEVIDQWLAMKGLELPELQLVNGAGLSRETRISARGLGTLLVQAHSSPYMPEYVASLPLAAMDGTLQRRFRGEPLAGRMHLKTGRLDDVAAIAGYVRSRSGRDYVVVALHNDRDVHRGLGQEVQNALLRWVFQQ